MDFLLKPKKWKSLPRKTKESILYRSKRDIDAFSKKVLPIIETVKKKGDLALCVYSKRFENVALTPTTLRVRQKEFDHAERSLDSTLKKALSIAMRNVYNYHIQHKHRKSNVLTEVNKGLFAGRQSTPIESVGMYVPRGKGRFPSMAYMLSIPAQIAEVPRRVMISPPQKDGLLDPACLYVAKITGVHEVYKIGGAHGIAALAFGTKKIQSVTKIVGPGSAFVSAAKNYVRNIVDTGLLAGPSEAVIIADSTTPALTVAYDLCIEAEHGPDSMSIVLTHKKEYAQHICKHLGTIISEAPFAQKKTLSAVFTRYPPIILTESEEHSIQICNDVAPEHLMIHSQSPSFIVSDIKNAGEILIGEHSAFSLANYAAGPNAVLPTGGMAKSFSGLCVADFMKQTSLIRFSHEGHAMLSPHVQTLAEYEGFYFHKHALQHRKK